MGRPQPVGQGSLEGFRAVSKVGSEPTLTDAAGWTSWRNAQEANFAKSQFEQLRWSTEYGNSVKVRQPNGS